MESKAAESRYKLMEEPPITFDNVGELPHYVDIEDNSSPELQAEIESHVAAVEQRDADRFSDRIKHTHRAPGRLRRCDGHQPHRAQQGQRRARRDDDDEQQDEQPQSRFGSLRAGLIVTIGLTALSALLVLVLFVSNSGAPTAPPNIEIRSHAAPPITPADIQLVIQAPPPRLLSPRLNRLRFASPHAPPTDPINGRARRRISAVHLTRDRLGSSPIGTRPTVPTAPSRSQSQAS